MKMKDEDERMRGRRGKRERKEEERVVTVVFRIQYCVLYGKVDSGVAERRIRQTKTLIVIRCGGHLRYCATECLKRIRRKTRLCFLFGLVVVAVLLTKSGTQKLVN